MSAILAHILESTGVDNIFYMRTMWPRILWVPIYGDLNGVTQGHGT